MSPLFDLTGRTALISGATRGLGRAFAQGLAQAGARVIVNGRAAESAQRVADKLRAQGLDALACAFDVTDEAAVTAAFAGLDAAGIGSEVQLWGDAIGVDAVAQAAGSTAYEVLCNVKRVARQFTGA